MSKFKKVFGGSRADGHNGVGNDGPVEHARADDQKFPGLQTTQPVKGVVKRTRVLMPAQIKHKD